MRNLEAMPCRTPEPGTGLDGRADPLMDEAPGLCAGDADVGGGVWRMLETLVCATFA